MLCPAEALNPTTQDKCTVQTEDILITLTGLKATCSKVISLTCLKKTSKSFRTGCTPATLKVILEVKTQDVLWLTLLISTLRRAFQINLQTLLIRHKVESSQLQDKIEEP